MQKDISADGLRGVAALSVVFNHFLLAFFPAALAGFYPWVPGSGALTGITERVASFPLLATLFNGRLAVCVFFALSGYVLTYRFHRTHDVGYIRAQAARRYFRLGIPVLASVLFAYVLIATGSYFASQAAEVTNSVWLAGMTPADVSIAQALQDGTFGALLLGHFSLNPVLWTMQIEFIGSMAIFAYCLLARGRYALLLAAVYIGAAVWLAGRDWPYYVDFLVGAHIGRLQAPSRKAWVYVAAFAGWLISAAPLAPALFRALPSLAEADLGLNMCSAIGGALIVYAVRFGLGAGILRSRVGQFLGRVSYPLYLLQLPIILSAGCWTFLAMLHFGFPRSLAAAGSLVICLSVTLVLAVAFERWIDRPAVRVGKWLIPSRRGADTVIADLL